MNMDMKFEQRLPERDVFQQQRWKYTTFPTLPQQTAMSEETYQIVSITAEDTGKVVNFLRQFFFKDEPLNVDVGLLGENGDDVCLELEEYSMASISEGLSLMAVSTSGKLVGVCLNGSHEPGHLEEIKAKADECQNPKFRKILRLLATVEQNADIFGKFPEVKQVIEVRIISVDDSWRGKGIATALLQRTREIAVQEGFPMIRVDCTSHYSARAVARLGLENIYTLRYDQYAHDGQIVFRPALPHTEVKTFVQRIQ